MKSYLSYWRRGWWSLLMQAVANTAAALVVLALTLMLVGVPHGDVIYVMLFVVLFFILIVPFNGWLFEVFAKRSQRYGASRLRRERWRHHDRVFNASTAP